WYLFFCVAEAVAPSLRRPDDNRGAELGRGGGPLDRERPPYGLHGRRADDPPGGTDGADGCPGVDPPDSRRPPAGYVPSPGPWKANGSPPFRVDRRRGLAEWRPPSLPPGSGTESLRWRRAHRWRPN